MLTSSEPQFLSSAENQAWPNGYTADIRPLSTRGRRVSVCCCPFSRASQQEGCECLSYTSVHLTTCSDITPLCLISPAHLPRAAPRPVTTMHTHSGWLRFQVAVNGLPVRACSESAGASPPLHSHHLVQPQQRQSLSLRGDGSN